MSDRLEAWADKVGYDARTEIVPDWAKPTLKAADVQNLAKVLRPIEAAQAVLLELPFVPKTKHKGASRRKRPEVPVNERREVLSHG